MIRRERERQGKYVEEKGRSEKKERDGKRQELIVQLRSGQTPVAPQIRLKSCGCFGAVSPQGL